ncbi:DNA-binding protein [candidate division WWE3 bacterium CG_4_9_14_0_2_um_filter_35_11]|uniref:DNA-binding protein n=1 Tax=candidate division WWE3 bacterium CG_4_9_14_0_2_um_filter_35_11 TaxID=1975077 RepID=A0A2M8EML8_UNCKA|nr:MAG: DNA-binding protein [candidate division WWE3 bacterium CG10_big_fil_rev_8_21_14_0_10_35_32]PJC23968.1 MAG: DNA-binding protein [candidate division WWE3 bacterium CG_4_9_14_0_2_um_filter_35_11]
MDKERKDTDSSKNVVKKKEIELITLQEAVGMLKVHPQTLRLWDKNGVLKAIRFGPRGDRRYKLKDIKEFIEKGNK